MTTTPVSSSDLSKISKYILAHERLIIVALALAVGVHFYSKVLGYMVDRDKRASDLAHQQLSAQVATNTQVAQANAAAEAKYEQLNAQLTASNAALVAAEKARDASELKQEVTDRALPLPDLGKRWVSLVSLPDADVAVTSSGFSVSAHGAQETVVALEKVPQLTSDLKDANAQIGNQATNIVALTGLNTGLHTQVDGLNKQIVDANKACEDDKNLIKAEARKSKLRWFIAGTVAGYMLRLVTSRGAAATGSGVTNVISPSIPLL